MWAIPARPRAGMRLEAIPRGGCCTPTPRGPVFRRWATAPELASTLRSVMREGPYRDVPVPPQLRDDQASRVQQLDRVAPGHPVLVVRRTRSSSRCGLAHRPRARREWRPAGHPGAAIGCTSIAAGSIGTCSCARSSTRTARLSTYRDARRARSGRCAPVPLPTLPCGGQEPLGRRQASPRCSPTTPETTGRSRAPAPIAIRRFRCNAPVRVRGTRARTGRPGSLLALRLTPSREMMPLAGRRTPIDNPAARGRTR